MIRPTFEFLMRGVRGCGVALAGCLAIATWAQTAPSQTPLLSRVSDPPAPNVMITIDDSGSMQAHWMPEGKETVNGKTVNMPTIAAISDMIDTFQSDPLHTGTPKGEAYGDPGDSTNVFQRLMRSPSTNTIFYNPAVLYLPWVRVNKVGSTYTVDRYPAAVASMAYWDPTDTSKSFDLTKTYDLDKFGNGGLSAKWCSSASACSSSSKTYHPMVYFMLKDGTVDPNVAASYHVYDLNSKTIDGANANDTFPSYPARVCSASVGANCCTTAKCTAAQETQNFANWFVYYHTRTHLVKGAMSEAINNVNGRIRVGLGTINTGTQSIDGQNTSVITQGVRMLDTDKKTLYNVLSGSNGIQHLTANGSTPLRQATWAVGQYFRRTAGTDAGSPWNNTPAASGGDNKVLACRRSYMLLTTDGYYNDDVSGATYNPVGNADAKTDWPDYAGTALNQDPLGYTPTKYNPAKWYPDNNAKMLADFATYNYVNDLQPSVANIVAQSGDDFAFWQHLNMFTVGLGVTGTITADQVPGLKGNPNGWGTDKIDDLLHAAVDAHGQFFSARDSVSMSTALSTALGSAASAGRSESGLATTTIALVADTLEFIPSYKSVTWTGDVVAKNLTTGDTIWTASDLVRTPANRNIWTWNGSASVVFDQNMSSTLKNLVDSSSSTQNDLINFVRGDHTNEGAGKPYRIRSGVLGDFIDSTPLYVQNSVDLGYDSLPGAPGYRDWINNTIAKRTDGVFFQGGNDGMLHAFRSKTGDEAYAYVPNVLLSKLNVLAQTDYGSPSNFHQDFVDGPQIETHAYIPTRANGAAHWSDLVVGSFGAGAKGLYAVDATDLSTVGTANTLLWEKSSDTDLGYIMSNVAVGKTSDGAWRAFVGNGVYSSSGHAVLLVVDLATGAIVNRVTLDSGTGNGLMGVQLIYDASKQVVAAYAGDMKGNLWRIELAGGTPVAGFGGKPLFQAINAQNKVQPIVVPPTIIANPSGGNMVLFGTGKLIDTADRDDTTTQSFYGVWDKTLAGASSASATSPFQADIAAGTPRKSLQQQVITADAIAGLFDVSSNAVDYASQNGWYMDLSPVDAKQRVVFPAVQLNQFVLINTVAPAPPPKDECDSPVGESAYFLLPAFTGAQYSSPVWDTNGDGVIDSNDSKAGGYSTGEGGKTTTIMKGSGTGENLNPNGGGKDFKIPHGIVSRVWQQLMTPPF